MGNEGKKSSLEVHRNLGVKPDDETGLGKLKNNLRNYLVNYEGEVPAELLERVKTVAEEEGVEAAVLLLHTLKAEHASKTLTPQTEKEIDELMEIFEQQIKQKT